MPHPCLFPGTVDSDLVGDTSHDNVVTTRKFVIAPRPDTSGGGATGHWPPSARHVEVYPCDVLLGRGKSVLRHSGNMAYSEYIKANCHSYNDSVSTREQEAICNEGVQNMHSRGGRFLRPRTRDEEHWEECLSHTARTKVKQVLRDMASRDSLVVSKRSQASSASSPTSETGASQPLPESAMSDPYTIEYSIQADDSEK